MAIAATILTALVLIAALAIFIVRKRKSESWQGKITDKEVRTSSGSDGYDTESYYLVVETNDDQTKKVGVSKKLFDSFSTGDKIIKEAGKYNPTKL